MMCISDEIQDLLDLVSKITGNSYYLCDLSNVRYVSSPVYKSLKESALSRELLSVLLDKGSKMVTSVEESIILNGDKQVRIFEDQLCNAESNSQIISYIVFDDELIGALITTTTRDNFTDSNVQFAENVVYFITKCIWYYAMRLERGVDNIGE